MGDKMLSPDLLVELLKRYNHTELHIHHTWKPDHSDFTGSNHQRLQDGMRDYHKNTRGWDDIAQHVTLFPDGQFLTGRDFSSQPASIYGQNGSNGRYPFMIEMIGNFDEGHDRLEGKQLQAILKVASHFDKSDKYIRFHRENASKSCPGTGIDKDDFMQLVKTFKDGIDPDAFPGLATWQKELLIKALESMERDGSTVDIDPQWIDRAKRGAISFDELTWLNTIAIARLNGMKK